jgi:hypothetical protein
VRLLAAALCLHVLACSSGDDSTLDASASEDSSSPSDATPPGDDATRPEAAPPPPACDVIADASLPDAYYPSLNVACTKAGDPCALPPSECVFDRYRIRYLKGYCSSSLACVFTYTREECGGADPVGCEAGVCTCGP